MKVWFIGDLYWWGRYEEDFKDVDVKVIHNFNILNNEMKGGLPDGVVCHWGKISSEKTVLDAVKHILHYCILHQIKFPNTQILQNTINGKVKNGIEAKQIFDLISGYNYLYNKAYCQ